MLDKKTTAITPKDQGQPEPRRYLFLQGVLKEAVVQGYSIEDQGRLYVVALRAYESRW